MTACQVIAAVALAAWVWLAVARGGYWRVDVRLPRLTAVDPDPRAGGDNVDGTGTGIGEADRWPRVAIVVPARNEAEMLPQTVPTLLGQDYPGPYTLIVADDDSTDGSGDRLRRDWPSVTVVRPGPPPAGWAGKLWALRAGIDAAGDVDYLLLTDADIIHRPDSLSALVTAAESGGFALVSQMARLRTETAWERLIVPAFVYFFALLFPFRWSNRPGARTAAAAGGCSLVRRDALAAAGGVDAIHGAIIDDVALARAIKRSGGRTFLGLGDHVDSIRPYPRLATLWAMVSRSAYAQLNHSPTLLVGTVAGLALMFWAPLAALLAGLAAGNALLAALGAAGYGLTVALYLPMVRYYRLPAWQALTLPYTATLYLGMTISSAVAHYRGAGGAWKGRVYASGASR